MGTEVAAQRLMRSNNERQRTALRAAADAERQTDYGVSNENQRNSGCVRVTSNYCGYPSVSQLPYDLLVESVRDRLFRLSPTEEVRGESFNVASAPSKLARKIALAVLATLSGSSASSSTLGDNVFGEMRRHPEDYIDAYWHSHRGHHTTHCSPQLWVLAWLALALRDSLAGKLLGTDR
jgi:hypothetical protein